MVDVQRRPGSGPIDVLATLSRAVGHLASDDEATRAAVTAVRQLRSAAPGTLDGVQHWTDALKRVEGARTALEETQEQVNLIASSGEIGHNKEFSIDPVMDSTIAARNAARTDLRQAIEVALKLHDSWHAPAQWKKKTEEEMSLKQRVDELKLTERLRLEWLQTRLLPTLNEWMAHVGPLRTLLEQLDAAVQQHAELRLTDAMGVQSLRDLQQELLAASDALDDSLTALRKAERRSSEPKAVAAAGDAARAARRTVQKVERRLHRERVELARLASTHYPELFVFEPLLSVGAEGLEGEEELRTKLRPELDYAHFEVEERLSQKLGARHEVHRARYNGEACVLKRYVLDDAREWEQLIQEVRLLVKLSHCPYVAEVQAVFIQREPVYAAFVQLPYYSGGDLLQWLLSTKPELCRRKELLTHLAHALQYMHERGLAHGDVKLGNVLVSVRDGGHATAHLADFESARQQRLDGTRGSSSMSGSEPHTEIYVAPEILVAPTAKPTAAADMFSYGVCCLFTCCLPDAASEHDAELRKFEAEGRQLTERSRALALSKDRHLPSLLESLLSPAKTNDEALDRRLSAPQVLLHPFHDTFEAIELARRETENAELFRLAKKTEIEEERQLLMQQAGEQRHAIETERRRHRQHMQQREERHRQHMQLREDEQRADADQQARWLRDERRRHEEEAQAMRADREALESHEREVAQARARQRQQAEQLRAMRHQIQSEEQAHQRREVGAQQRLAQLQAQEQQMLQSNEATRGECERKRRKLADLKRELVARETADLSNQPFGRKVHELRRQGGDVAEYLAVVDRVEKYAQADHQNPIQVLKIEKVFNRQIEERFRAARASKLRCTPTDCVSMQLFHGTNKAAIEGITKHGFQLPAWKDTNMFGTGIYFATDSTKSAQSMYTKGSKCLLLCDVLLGKPCTIQGLAMSHPLSRHVKQAHGSQPPRHFLDVNRERVREAGFDSVCAPRDGSLQTGGVRHDEYIVYDPDQALPRYIIHFGTYAQGLAHPGLAPSATFAIKQITPQRTFDANDELQMHFRVCESHLLRQLGHSGSKLVKVEYVINPPLMRQFEEQRKEFEKHHVHSDVVLAFHGTQGRVTVDNIVRNNFDPSKIGSATDAGWYGKGFYFSEDPKVSFGYGGQQNMLLCRVLPGKSFDTTQRMDGQPIKSGFHSHRVQKDANGYGKELVIANPKQILPCYILHIA